MVSNRGVHLFLGPASHWSPNKNGDRVHSEETAHTFPIRDTDNKQIGNVTKVTRSGRDKWTFKIFDKEGLSVSLYDAKEDALAGAVALLTTA